MTEALPTTPMGLEPCRTAFPEPTPVTAYWAGAGSYGSPVLSQVLSMQMHLNEWLAAVHMTPERARGWPLLCPPCGMSSPDVLDVFALGSWTIRDGIGPAMIVQTRPDRFVVQFNPYASLEQERPTPSSEPGRTRPDPMECIEDLGHWLGVPRHAVARLVGLAPRTVAYWASGATAAPMESKTRRLYAAHSAVRSVVEKLGLRGARSWLEEASQLGARRVDLLQAPNGAALLLREARHVLFAAPQRSSARYVEDEDDSFELGGADPAPKPPKRARRPPKSQ